MGGMVVSNPVKWKPITFAPKRGAILLCDFDMARVPPSIDKRRQAIVFSLTEFNHKHALGPGRSMVVPTTASEPETTGPEDVFIKAGKYWSLEEDCWALGKLVTTVSHRRLSTLHRDRVQVLYSEFLDDADMLRVGEAIKHSLGLT